MKNANFSIIVLKVITLVFGLILFFQAHNAGSEQPLQRCVEI